MIGEGSKFLLHLGDFFLLLQIRAELLQIGGISKNQCTTILTGWL